MSDKATMQNVFEPFNKNGSWMTIQFDNFNPIDLGIIDSYTVTRVKNYADRKGNITQTEFWLLIKCLGYQEGPQYSHTINVKDWNQEDGFNMDLLDDRRRKFRIEMIFPDQDTERFTDYMKWMDFKDKNKNLFPNTDKLILETHTLIARGW